MINITISLFVYRIEDLNSICLIVSPLWVLIITSYSFHSLLQVFELYNGFGVQYKIFTPKEMDIFPNLLSRAINIIIVFTQITICVCKIFTK